MNLSTSLPTKPSSSSHTWLQSCCRCHLFCRVVVSLLLYFSSPLRSTSRATYTIAHEHHSFLMEPYPGVGVTSIFRLLASFKITTEDPTYAFLGTGTWSALEIGAGVDFIYLSSMTPIVCWIIGAFKSSSSKSPTSNKYSTFGSFGLAEPLRSSQSNPMPDQRRQARAAFVVEQDWNRAVG